MEYRAFIKTVEIEQINLSSLHVEKNEDYASGLDNISVVMNYNERNHYVKSGKLHVWFGMGVIALSSNVTADEGGKISAKDIDPKERLFSIDAVFDLSYSLKGVDDADVFVQENEEQVEDFCKKNVPINAWPYLREIINSCTIRMGVPPLTLKAFKRV